jgi:hypothetical protein
LLGLAYYPSLSDAAIDEFINHSLGLTTSAVEFRKLIIHPALVKEIVLPKPLQVSHNQG